MADTVPPKHPSQRRRRNKPPVPPRTLKGQAVTGIPELPGDNWNDFAREYWETIWTSPMAVAGVYIKADIPALIRLAQLANRVGEGTIGTSALGEMRQLEDRFGLSPLSRRRLQIDITLPDEGKDTGGELVEPERWLKLADEDAS